jgi:hypothetical protein
LTFSLYTRRFVFLAREAICFPEGKSANVLRGALGMTLLGMLPEESAYSRIFKPVSEVAAPSGLADLPRPFVLRASHLDGRTIQPGEKFHLDLNSFDTRDRSLASLTPALALFTRALEQMARKGLGPRGGRAELDTSGSDLGEAIEIPMTWDGPPVERITVRFVTPTELKSGGQIASRPEFRTLFARARDRVSTLRALYGDGPLDLDFRGIGGRASLVNMIRCEIREVDVQRRSSRTTQVHSIGGFVGETEYAGDLGEFMPILRAAQWTGIGRHTVWGNGALEVTIAAGRGINSKP